MWVEDLAKLGVTEQHHYFNWLQVYTLTPTLRRVCKELSVKLVRQEFASTSEDEKIALNIKEDRSLVREVHLLGDNETWVQCRVVVPMATYQHFKDTLDNLGTKPIGETLLYPNKHTRTPFSYAHTANGYSRRSIFDLEGYKLMVSECFLLQIPAYPTSVPSVSLKARI